MFFFLFSILRHIIPYSYGGVIETLSVALLLGAPASSSLLLYVAKKLNNSSMGYAIRVKVLVLVNVRLYLVNAIIIRGGIVSLPKS